MYRFTTAMKDFLRACVCVCVCVNAWSVALNIIQHGQYLPVIT